MSQQLSLETARVLVKALLLLNQAKRFTIIYGGLDSYKVAAELNQHLKDHGLSMLDPELQPPPASNLRR